MPKLFNCFKFSSSVLRCAWIVLPSPFGRKQIMRNILLCNFDRGSNTFSFALPHIRLQYCMYNITLVIKCISYQLIILFIGLLIIQHKRHLAIIFITFFSDCKIEVIYTSLGKLVNKSTNILVNLMSSLSLE